MYRRKQQNHANPFLYTNNELSERETKKKNPIHTVAETIIKCLRINLTKEVKGPVLR